MANSMRPVSLKGGLRAPKSARKARGASTFGSVSATGGRGNPGNAAGRVRGGKNSGGLGKRGGKRMRGGKASQSF